MNFEQLAEVKRGQTGTGLLIENDGRIDNNTDLIRQIHEDINSNHKFVIPEHFVVPAIFQKYGIKNANGRIYPEKILKREVEKYYEKINNHNALGSLDHPSCQLADTKILTDKGWVQITDVKVGDNILTLNQNNKIEIKPVERKISEYYEGKLIHIVGKGIDISVTPNHKFPFTDKHGVWKEFYTAQELYDGKLNNKNLYFYKSGNWDIKEKISNKIFGSNLCMPIDAWVKIFALFISGLGKCILINGVKYVRLTIKKTEEDISNDVFRIIKDINIDYKFSYDKEHDITIDVKDDSLYDYLIKFSNENDKYIPYHIKSLSKEQLKIFYKWYCVGYFENEEDIVLSGKSKRLIEDLNEIQFKIGRSGCYYYDVYNDLYSTQITYNDVISVDELTSITQEDYKGMVYCVEVENHDFYTMCKNGKCLWSGNSSAISGHDISHNILNLEWKGRTLVGEMELHLTPGYIKYGICSTSGDLVANMLLSGYLIGVSSRGVGSVEQKYGDYIVCDDYEICCWDVVIEPSTPGAFIKNNTSELERFIESNNTNNDKEHLFEDSKIDYIEKILKE